MAIEGVDYAWQKPTPAALAAAGKAFACRYLCGDPTNGKNLTAAEAKALTAAGVAIVANWEWASGDARKGYATGRAYATEALKQATACGMPATRPIYFSVDFDPAAGDWAAISEYFRGVRSVLGVERTGIYGGYNTISRAVAGKWGAWFWQTFAWSNGRWHPSAHIQQYRNGVTLDGADLDLDRAMTSDYGQWTVGAPTPAPAQEDTVEHPYDGWLWAATERARAALAGADAVFTIPGETKPRTEPNVIAQRITDVAGKVDALAQQLGALAANPPGAVTITDEQLERVLRKVVGSVDGASPAS